MKICTKCHTPKTLECFDIEKRSKDGRRALCKDCRALYCKKRYEQKKDLIAAKNKERYERDKESILSQKKEYYGIKKETIKSKKTERYRKDPTKIKASSKKMYEKYKILHPEKLKKWAKNYLSTHPDYAANYIRKKRRTDIRFKLSSNISCQIYFSLRANKSKRSWESLVGYTVEQLKEHLNKTLPQGYSWEDFLSGKLHIDHKTPKVAFNFRSPEDIDFKKCWALSNLQLLPDIENMKKGAKLSQPFQPSLSGV
jgi:hypothetical protein